MRKLSCLITLLLLVVITNAQFKQVDDEKPKNQYGLITNHYSLN